MGITSSIQVERVRQAARCLAVLAVTTAVAPNSPIGIPSAVGAACPDVEVVFARGAMEPPGVGVTGQAFVDSLSSQVAGKSLGVYPVNYPAHLDFPAAADGVVDAAGHVAAMAVNCPETQMVLGGFSRGAAVAGYVTSDRIPDGYTLPADITGPMVPEVAEHVAAVVLFGRPSSEFLARYDGPPITIGHLFAPKTLDLCAPGDPVCSADGGDPGAHTLYAVNGMESQAADFVARHLASG